MRLNGNLSKVLVLALVITIFPSIAFSAQKIVPGSSCKVLKQKITYQKKIYTCTKSGQKLVWSKGVVVAKPSATPSPAPTVTVTATPSPAPTVTVTATPSPAPSPTSILTNSSNYLGISSCRLGIGTSFIGVGFSQNPYRVRNTKPIRALIFPIDFPDLIGNSDPQKDFAYVTDGVSDYFKQMSDGKSVFVWTIHPKFVRYGSKVADANLGGRNTSGYGTFSAEALKMAMQTVDTSAYDLIVYAPPITTTRDQIAIGPAFTSNGSTQINATMLDGQSYDVRFRFPPANTTAHEVGHLMGLADLYNYDAANEGAANPGKNIDDLQFKYMGIFDLMGWAEGAGVELTAWNRWLIDLIGDDQIRCLPTSSTTTLLTPVEVNGGVKGAVIPLSTTEALVFESRRALRFDKNMGKESEGVLVYKVNTSISSGLGPMRVIGRPGSTDAWFRDAPLKLNESRIVDGYTIRVIESGLFGDVVEVSQNK